MLWPKWPQHKHLQQRLLHLFSCIHSSLNVQSCWNNRFVLQQQTLQLSVLVTSFQTMHMLILQYLTWNQIMSLNTRNAYMQHMLHNILNFEGNQTTPKYIKQGYSMVSFNHYDLTYHHFFWFSFGGLQSGFTLHNLESGASLA